MAKKIKDAQTEAVEGAEAAAEDHGTSNPVMNPETSATPEPGTTEDTAEILNLDDAKGLSPNVTVSGTKGDGQGGQVLLDTVDPAVANAALLPDTAPPEPQSPASVPEDTAAKPGEGEVRFRVTADNKPFYSGGPMTKGETYIMSKEEADVLTSLNAGNVVSE